MRWVRSLCDPLAAHEIFISRLPRVEVIAAVSRRGRGGIPLNSPVASILAQFRQDAARQFGILGVTPTPLADAELLAESHGLRGDDAVQLAISPKLHRPRQAAGLSALTLVSADQPLNDAALAEGMAVDDPTVHP